MKARILTAIIVVLLIGLFVCFWRHSVSEKKISGPENKISQDAAVASALAKQNPNTVAIIESNFARVHPFPGNSGAANATALTVSPGPPSPLQFTNFPPAIVLENMSRAVRQYGTMFGGNPVGNNPKHINFLNAEAGMRVNDNGELVDPWGTPYFFHQLSGTVMEIHSAGPDKKMWNLDDLVVK